MKRFFVFILSLALLFAMSVPAFASDSTCTYSVILDDKSTRMAQEYIDGVKYVYTLDKAFCVLTTQTFDASGSMTSVKTFDLPELAHGLPTGAIGVASCAYGHRQETFLGYGYEQIDSTKYKLQNGGMTVYRYLPNDREVIQNFVKAVDNLKTTELAVAAKGGNLAIWDIDVYVPDDLSIGEAATAFGVGYADVVALKQATENCEKVWALYFE